MGSTIGIIGSFIMLIAVILRLSSVNFYTLNVLLIIRVVFYFVWPVLGITGAFFGYRLKKNLGGSLLVIAGIGGFIALLFGLGASMVYDVFLMSIGGILVLKFTEIKLKVSEKSNRKTWRIVLMVVGMALISIDFIWVPKSFNNELAITNPFFILFICIGIFLFSLGIVYLLCDDN